MSVFDSKTTKGAQYAGTEEVADRNYEIGMNFPLWDKDRGGFHTTVAHTTGGVSAAFGDHAGVEVGENYSGAFGEDRQEPSYPAKNPMIVSPGVGAMGPSGATSGRITASAPQNYRIFGTEQHRK